MGANKEGGNQYSEKWTLEESEAFMINAVALSENKDYDFIGEVAQAQGTYHHVYAYIADKFPELKHYFTAIKANCEANCFFNGKKGNIVPSLSIMNLKSNHGWTDRSEVKEVKQEQTDLSGLSIEEIEQLAAIQAKMNGKHT